jgi:anhydro-N-acetylmuramic acid kinase
MSAHFYIGLMSGTSLDGIDAALIQIQENHIQLTHSLSCELPPELKQDILKLCNGDSRDEIELLGRCDRALGSHFGNAALALCKAANISPAAITAIGSHGQTIRHRPPDQHRKKADAFTLQIGDPNTISEISGITTIADFRRRDIAAGGQGAPLVPAFHAAAFSKQQIERVIVNIGGMANITVLAANGEVFGFDTGPGNVLMDSWINHCAGKAFDHDGDWARSGQVNSELLNILLSDGYYSVEGPKSTGREQFSLSTIQQILDKLGQIKPQDVQASLLELTARSICDAINKHAHAGTEIYLCGGGAANITLMERIQALLPKHPIANTAELGIDADWVEAAAFAWLAQQTLAGLAGNVPAVTGAAGPRVLGAVYPR